MNKYKKIIISLVVFLIITGLNVANAYLNNPYEITIREEKIYSNKIDEGANGLTIAYFCDLHYGTLINGAELDNVIDIVNLVGADVLIFGGDLIDSSITLNREIEENLINSLSKLTYKFGKYAVLGDEDQFNKETLLNIYEESGFEVLTNSNRKIYLNNNYPINLVGIDSLINGSPDLTSAFSSIDSNYFTLTVTHCPDLYANLKNGNSDYVLAGHSLGGPVDFPVFNLINRPSGAKNYFSGKSRDEKSTLDITNGVGLKDSKTRFLADAEVVFYRLYAN